MVTKVIPNIPEHVFTLSDEEFKEALEGWGFPLPTGSKVLRWRRSRSFYVKSTSEQVATMEAFFEGCQLGAKKKDLHIVVEAIEVEYDDFSEWIYHNRFQTTANAFREEVENWLKKKDAHLLDIATVTGFSGQRMKTESAAEYIYPTEMDPPEIPNQLTLDGKNLVKTIPTSSTAFETRNLGTTLETDPVLGADGMTVDLNFSFERAAHVDDNWWPSREIDEDFQIRMPTFITEKITTQIISLNGDYTLVGSFRPDTNAKTECADPYILVFARADLDKTEGDASSVAAVSGDGKYPALNPFRKMMPATKYNVPESNAVIAIQRTLVHPAFPRYQRKLTIIDGEKTAAEESLYPDVGTGSRANLYKTGDQSYTLIDMNGHWYEIDLANSEIHVSDSLFGLETPANFVGTFTYGGYGFYRFIPSSEQKENTPYLVNDPERFSEK